MTLTQLPVAFSGGSMEKDCARARADAFDDTGKLGARIHVKVDGRLLARLDAREIGFLEVRVDPPFDVLDDGEDGVPAWMTVPGRSLTLESQPALGAVTWVFTLSCVALSSWAAAARSCTVGVVTVSVLSCAASNSASASE